MILFLFLILLNISSEIVPIWDLPSSGINLSPTLANEYIYTTVEKTSPYPVKIRKKITINGNEIIYTNLLSVNNGEEFAIDFDNIESYYHLNNYIICPKGKYHPYDATQQKYLDPTNFEMKANWDLKCYHHYTGFFLVFYLMNGEKHFYYSYSDQSPNFQWRTKKITDEFYDFKLENGNIKNQNNDWVKYKTGVLFLKDNILKLGGFTSHFEDQEELIYIFNEESLNPSSIDLLKNKTDNQAWFNTDSDEFYFFGYNNISDFSCGYSNATTSNYHNIVIVQIKYNSESPFEFIDEVEIRDINNLLNNKYIYYNIYNNYTGKTNHGLYDIKLNKIMFNTDENLQAFIPYSSNSILIIKDNTFYKVCPINDDNSNSCLEDCTDGTNFVIRDVNGNKCGTGCENNKYLLIPDNFCDLHCDTNIYIVDEDNKRCGLCKDMNSSYIFKLIGGTDCLGEIPIGAYEYNSKLHLLKCSNGYILNENTCIPHCFNTCETCTDYSEDENDQKCLSCKEGYFLQDQKCYLIIIPTTISTTIQEIKCLDQKCLKCSNESNILGLCLTCNEEEGYKKLNYTYKYIQFLDCIKKDDPKFISYYFNETSQEYRPCYKTCKTCLREGNPVSHYCLECKADYMFKILDNPYNNCVAYSEYNIISAYNQYKPLNIYQCPEEAKYYLRNKKICIDDCKKDPEYRYLYNGNCLNECPSWTKEENYTCIVNNNECFYGKNELYLNEKDDFRVIETLVKSYASEFYYTEHYISLYENQNYSMMVYKDSNCIKELKLEMPSIDFQACYEKVKYEYDISQNLIIVIVDKKESNNPKSFYSFYHPISGIKLNAEKICKDETIVIFENLVSLLNKNDTTYEAIMNLISQGINIFDLNSPIYTDICFYFDNPIKRDIPLNDRIKTIYPNVELCDEGCHYKGINLEDMTSICNCKFNDIANNELIKENALIKDAVGKIFELISDSNILVFKCIKYVFKYFHKSVGGLISLGLIIFHIILSLIFIFVELNKVKIYLFNLSNNYIKYLKRKDKKKVSSPPKLSIEIKSNNDTFIPKANSIIESNSNFSKIKLNPVIVHKYKKHDDKIFHFQKEKNIKTEKDLNKSQEKNKVEINVDDSSKKLTTYNKTFYKKFFKEYMSTPIDDMEFDDAIVFDKRKYCEHLVPNLIEDQIFTNTFIAEDPLKPRTIKIMVFVLNIMLYFVVNGLFFNDEVIGKLYNMDEEKENFFSYLPRSIDNIIYTALVSIIIAMITDFFFIEEKKVKGIFRREKDDKFVLKQQIIEMIKELKKRYIAFIITVFIILIISFIYLLCFNYVYPYTQVEWVKSSVTIMIIIQILYLLKCIFETSFRFLSYKLKSELLFKLCKLLD